VTAGLNGGRCEGHWCEGGTRLDAFESAGDERGKMLRTVADRVGAMRPDGTATPHSLTHAVQMLGTQVLALKRTVEERCIGEPPADLLDALDEDTSEASRIDITRPPLALKRIRKAEKQRNWMAIGLGIGGFIAGIYEALKLAGVLK
jgi:hypothetical protein